MMKYQKMNNNFIPKVAGATTNPIVSDNPTPQPEQNPLLDENKKLTLQLEHYREKLNELEGILQSKEHEVLSSNNRIVSLQDNLRKYEDLQHDLTVLENLQVKIQTLSEENSELKSKIQSYQEHIQMTYIIMLILAIV